MTDTTRAALAQALEALRGAGIVMMRSIAAGRIGERYSYIQARDGSMIEATGPINSVNEAVTAVEAAMAGPQSVMLNGLTADETSASASVAGLTLAAPQEHDKRCECCGYMTHHREHLGCIRAAIAAPELLEALRGEIDCRTCRLYVGRGEPCRSVAVCTDGDCYRPTDIVRQYRDGDAA